MANELPTGKLDIQCCNWPSEPALIVIPNWIYQIGCKTSLRGLGSGVGAIKGASDIGDIEKLMKLDKKS